MNFRKFGERLPEDAVKGLKEVGCQSRAKPAHKPVTILRK